MPRKDRNVFTIMIVPHAETKVFTFRLSTLVFQAACYVLVCLFLFMMILAQSFQTMLANMWELEELRLVNREQRDQIEQLLREAEALQQRMVLLDELEKQVREMMELESYGGPSSSISLSPQPGASGSQAAIASVSAAPAGGSAGGNEATTASAYGTDRVSPQVTGLASVSRETIRRALNALDMFNRLKGEAAARSESLEEVRQAIAQDAAYFAAKPSIWPALGYVTSRYGYRRTPFGAGHHGGYDIAGRYGTPIVATADGTVVFSGWDSSYGIVVVVDHSYGWSTVYAHCAKAVVDVGDRVRRGQVLGFIGSTGQSTGPHVHYEVRVNGRTVNPRYYLLGNG